MEGDEWGFVGGASFSGIAFGDTSGSLVAGDACDGNDVGFCSRLPGFWGREDGELDSTR